MTEHTWGKFRPIRGKHIGPGPDDYELLGGKVCQMCRSKKFYTTNGPVAEHETCEEGFIYSAHDQ